MPTDDAPKPSPFVSVVVPAYNDPGVAVTLESVSNQTYPTDQYEIVVVNNNSDDGTQEVIDTYSRRYPDRVRGVFEREQGLSNALNAGIDAASGDVIAFIDSDMTVEVDWLESVIDVLESGDHDYMGCRVETYPPDGRETVATIYDRLTLFRMGEYLAESNFVGSGCLTVRREVLDAVGGFDSRLDSVADNEFGKRVHAAGFDQHFEPSITMYHPARASVGEHLRKNIKVGRGSRELAILHPEHFDTSHPLRPRSYLPPHPRRFVARLVARNGGADFSRREWAALYALDCVRKYGRVAGSLYEYLRRRRSSTSG